MMISIIAAVAENGVIGRTGDLPWRLRSDLRRFKHLTLGHTVIVGRKTHESIVRRLGTPLPDRRTVVLSRTPGYTAERCLTAQSWEDAVRLATPEEEIFVIGGAEIYGLALPVADRMYLTRVHAAVAGDAYFPPFERGDWKVMRRESRPEDVANEFNFTFEDLVRIEIS